MYNKQYEHHKQIQLMDQITFKRRFSKDNFKPKEKEELLEDYEIDQQDRKKIQKAQQFWNKQNHLSFSTLLYNSEEKFI